MMAHEAMESGSPRYTQDNADVLVFTYKEGLLSAVAHDLKIRVTRFSIHIDDETHAISATFDPSSLQVVSAMKDGQEAHSTLSQSDKHKIEENIVNDVLHPKKHPQIQFKSTKVAEDEGGTGYHVTGQLSLHGKTKEVTFTSRTDGEGQVAEIKLHQPDFGISPYSALLGTLKIKADVKVTIALPGAL
ncbi:MAG: YceI family protein [Polyangiaceae bacterium]|nr:YceI family protein [Polyangiaceae bacterium]